MGLLDQFDAALNSDKGMQALGLLAAAGPSATPMSFGQRLYGAMQQDRQRKAEEDAMKQRKMMQELQMQSLMAQAQERRRAQEQEQQRRNYLGAVDQSAGPAMPVNTPQALAAGLSLPEIGALQPQQAKAPEFKVVGGRLVRIQGDNVAEAYAPPEKPDLNSLIVMGPDGKPTVNSLLLGAKREIAKSGAANISQSYGAPVAGVDAAGKPVFFQPAKGGGAPAIVPGVAPAKADKPLTESQAKASVFRSQMEAAERELATVGRDPSKLSSQVDIAMAAGPLNIVASQEAQRARQAQEQWAEAFLRFKTGAASTEDEVKRNVRTFFPQQGDKKDVIEQKARMRQQAQQDIAIAAGIAPGTRAAKQPPASATSLSDLLNKYGN